MRLIGINGFKRSGKNTTATLIEDTLVDNPEEVPYQVAFADKLKMLGAKALGFDRPPRELIELMDQAKEEWDIRITRDDTPIVEIHNLTGREFLQDIGNNARDLFGDTFWIDQVLPRIPWGPILGQTAQESEPKPEWAQEDLAARYPFITTLIVTDVRYANEAQRILDLGGEVWEVVRPGTASDGHASEQPLPRELVSRTLNNDSDLDHLSDLVKVALV